MDDIKVVEAKPPLVNQHCVVYKFASDLCDADYVGFTSRHLFQRIAEHKYSAIARHLTQAARLQCTKTVHCFKEMPHEAGLFTVVTKCSSSGT